MPDLVDERKTEPKSLTLIQSLQRGLRLVEVVVERGPMTARGLSDAIGIGLPTTYHLLRTLVHEDYLVRVAGGLYGLGPQLHSAAEREKDASVVRVLREALGELRDATAATALVAEFDGREAVITHLAPTRKGPRFDLWIGMGLPLHATALGKCVLGHLHAPACDDALGRTSLPAFTWRTSVDPARLRRDLDAPGARSAEEEFLLGVACLAVPLVADRPAAVGIAFASSLGARRRRELEQELLGTARGLAVASRGPEAA
jgi:DNA-binding IclR family transcriptional regulator